MYIDQLPDCCGVDVIAGVSNHKSPEEVIKNFVQSFERTDYLGGRRERKVFFDDVQPFYVFAGVDKVTPSSSFDDEKVYYFADGAPETERDDDGYYYHDGGLVPYGYCEALWRYIRDNGLGNIVRTSEAQPNKLNHPTHMLRVYVWTPDLDALKKWYTAYKKENR